MPPGFFQVGLGKLEEKKNFPALIIRPAWIQMQFKSFKSPLAVIRGERKEETGQIPQPQGPQNKTPARTKEGQADRLLLRAGPLL